MTDLEDSLDRAKTVADRVAESIEGKPVDKDTRKLLAGSAFQLTVEHHRSMIVLVENQGIGSALALSRPLFESFALGYWLIYRALDEDIDRFVKRGKRPKLEALRRMLVDDNPGGPSHKETQRFVSTTHELVHGGIGHLLLRMSTSRLGPSYSSEQVLNALDVATWTTAMAALDLLGAVIEDAAAATSLTGEVQAILKF